MPSRKDRYTALPAHGSSAENLGLQRNLKPDKKLHTLPGSTVEGDLGDTKSTHSKEGTRGSGDKNVQQNSGKSGGLKLPESRTFEGSGIRNQITREKVRASKL
jgi:hypothetical protein